MSKILAIAHRGACTLAPENTLAAFRAALDHGADGIELDVHLSADGHLVVIHDHTIDRTTNGTGEVEMLTLEQLLRHTIDGNHSIPTLKQVLDTAGPNCLVNIELKTKECAQPAVDLINHYISRHGFPSVNFIVSSFDWTALQLIRESHPEIPLGVLTATDLDLAIAFAGFIKAETLHPYYHLLTDEAMERIRQEHIKVFTWTVNEHQDIQHIKSLKPTGIISDYPERI